MEDKSFTLAKKDVAAQEKLPKKYGSIQVSGCIEYLSLSLDCRRDSYCVKRDQVDDLLCLVSVTV